MTTAHCLNESCLRTWKLDFAIVDEDASQEDIAYCMQLIKGLRCSRCVKARRLSDYTKIEIEREV